MLTGRAVLDNAAPPEAIFWDDFDRARPATIVTPFPTDKKGTWNSVTNPTTASISGGKLNLVGGGFNLVGDTVDRRVGRAGVAVMRRTGGNYISVGFGSPVVGFSDNSTFLINGLLNHVAVMSNNIDYQVFVVLRSIGQFFLVRGGIYTKLTLLWVENNNSVARLTTSVGGFDGVGSVDYFKVVDFGSAWHDWVFVTRRLAGVRTAGDTLTHAPNCILYFDVTTRPSSGTIDYHFRKQDASNYWLLRINASGDMQLFEVVGGIETQRQPTASGMITSGDRVGIICDGATIRVMEGAPNLLTDARIIYNTASSFQTATNAELVSVGTGGVVSEMQSWIRTVEENNAPGALAIANRIFPFQ